MNNLVSLLKIKEKKSVKTFKGGVVLKLTKKCKALASENVASIRHTTETFLFSDKNSFSGPSLVDSMTIVYGDVNVKPYIFTNSVDWSLPHLLAKLMNS